MLTNGERTSVEIGDPEGSSHHLATVGKIAMGLTAFSFITLMTAIFIDRQNKADVMSQPSETRDSCNTNI
jgi:hypothetical protein